MPFSNAVILADADNTLWDTDALFADAQLSLLQAVNPRFVASAPDKALEHVRGYDQAIARIDHRHLRYPPSLLVHALSLGAEGQSAEQAALAVTRSAEGRRAPEALVEETVARYLEMLSRQPALLPGVWEGLSAARAQSVDVWILTEGAAEKQRERAKHLGIATLIKGVSEAAKTREQFERQKRRFAPAQLYVIGDQPDRDIAPAREAGCIAVLVTGRFRPGWISEAEWSAADHVAETFDRAVAWVLAGAETPQAMTR